MFAFVYLSRVNQSFLVFRVDLFVILYQMPLYNLLNIGHSVFCFCSNFRLIVLRCLFIKILMMKIY